MNTRNSYRGVTLDGTSVEVMVEGEQIARVTPIGAADHDGVAEDLPLIGPPLVDLQANGALGHGFNRIHEDPEGLDLIAAHQRRHGVGRSLATFTTTGLPWILDPFEAALKSSEHLS